MYKIAKETHLLIPSLINLVKYNSYSWYLAWRPFHSLPVYFCNGKVIGAGVMLSKKMSRQYHYDIYRWMIL
jgi:hypothetical protein